MPRWHVAFRRVAEINYEGTVEGETMEDGLHQALAEYESENLPIVGETTLDFEVICLKHEVSGL